MDTFIITCEGIVFAAGRRWPALDGVAASADRFVEHGMYRLSPP
jgi:hypothetical protein